MTYINEGFYGWVYTHLNKWVGQIGWDQMGAGKERSKMGCYGCVHGRHLNALLLHCVCCGRPQDAGSGNGCWWP